MIRSIRPLKQPTHSALCGLYAAANAARRVAAELDLIWDDQQEAQLIEELIEELGPSELASNFIGQGADPGLDGQTVSRLVRKSQEWLFRVFGVQSFIDPLSKFSSTKQDVLDQLRFQSRLKGHVAIISLWGDPIHWSVASHVRDGEIRLFDSSNVIVVPKSFRTAVTTTAAKAAVRKHGGCVVCLEETLFLSVPI